MNQEIEARLIIAAMIAMFVLSVVIGLRAADKLGLM